MKTLLTLFVLFFSFLVFADDISDFEIEGISIGDSALDYFSEAEINKAIKSDYYKDKDNLFSTSEFYMNENSYLTTYDGLQITYKTNDIKYQIYHIAGLLASDPSECKNKRMEIIKEIENIFINLSREEVNSKHLLDKSGQSKIIGQNYYFKSSDYIQVACYVWGKKMNYIDHLRLSASKREFADWREN